VEPGLSEGGWRGGEPHGSGPAAFIYHSHDNTCCRQIATAEMKTLHMDGADVVFIRRASLAAKDPRNAMCARHMLSSAWPGLAASARAADQGCTPLVDSSTPDFGLTWRGVEKFW
jgi:hypothetical protein